MATRTITYTECFYRSHRKEPRGRGYWIMTGPFGFCHASTGTLAEVRRAAIKEFRAEHGEAPEWLDVQP
jgi:hypothetical protein